MIIPKGKTTIIIHISGVNIWSSSEFAAFNLFVVDVEVVGIVWIIADELLFVWVGWVDSIARVASVTSFESSVPCWVVWVVCIEDSVEI